MNVYEWSKIPAEVARPGVVRHGFAGDNVMLVLNELHPGMETRPHSHPFEQVSCILQGDVVFTVGDERHRVGPGSVFRIPPHVVHFAEVVGDEVALNLDVFAPPRDDYRHLTRYQDEAEKVSSP
ncbi:MAG: cupin domain-containing protein [Ardenticatenaceae bacterium]|nr:cupin domain-containing protein [Ardenticatenaceae bacterium]